MSVQKGGIADVLFLVAIIIKRPLSDSISATGDYQHMFRHLLTKEVRHYYAK